MTTKSLFLRDIWYYALPGHLLKPGQLIAKTLLNESIVFRRTRTGSVFASHNDGLHPVKSYLVREAQGNVWIYMARHDRSLPQDDVPRVPVFDNRAYQAVHVMRFPCDIDHAVVGLIDPAHIAFAHRAWWWRSPTTLQEVVKTFEPSFQGFTMRQHTLEQQTFLYRLIGHNPEVEISFRLPGIRTEQLSTSQNTVCNLTTVTPISDVETEVTTLFYTTLPWFPILKPLLLSFTHSFLAQDREILRKQQEGLKQKPPVMLVGDADAQARWYYRLKKEFAQANEKGRPFSNPLKEQTLRWRS